MKLIKFEAEWCIPCQRLNSVMSTMEDLPDIEFVDVGIDPDTTAKYNVRGIPTLVLLDDDGKELGRKVGEMQEDTLRAFVSLYNGFRSV